MSCKIRFPFWEPQHSAHVSISATQFNRKYQKGTANGTEKQSDCKETVCSVPSILLIGLYEDNLYFLQLLFMSFILELDKIIISAFNAIEST